MHQSKIISNIIIAALGLSLLFLIYRFFIKKSAEAPAGPGLVSVGSVTPAEETTDEFLNILLSLQKIELKNDIFTTPFFKSLQDFSTPLPEETPGRINPFAPIGVGGRPAQFAQNAGAGTTTPPARGGSARDRLLDALNRP